MRSRLALRGVKRKHCFLCSSEVEIETILPSEFAQSKTQLETEEDSPRPKETLNEVFNPFIGGAHTWQINPEANEDVMSWNEVQEFIANELGDYEPVEKPSIRISDLIARLEELKSSSGDLVLCVADEHSLLTLSNDNFDLNVTSKNNYGFSIGLEEENYLSVQIN